MGTAHPTDLDRLNARPDHPPSPPLPLPIRYGIIGNSPKQLRNSATVAVSAGVVADTACF